MSLLSFGKKNEEEAEVYWTLAETVPISMVWWQAYGRNAPEQGIKS